MIFNRRKPLPLLPFTVTALKQDEPPIRIGVLAHSTAEAIGTARELFPDHIIGTAALQPEWEDGPA